jgi:hypothetical protein
VPKSVDQASPFQLPRSIELQMSDDALVTFGPPVDPGAVSFHDIGYMPVNALTISGHIAGNPLPGGLDGMFIHYVSDGVQHFAVTGAPSTADYTGLHYELVGYKGNATFGHAADGTPTISGIVQQTVLTQGDLIAGHLAFGADGGITGEVDATVQFGGRATGRLDISVQHTAGDIGHPSASSLTLSGGKLDATFVPLPVG